MSNTRTAGAAPGDDRAEAHTEKNPAVEAGMSKDLINIPDNVLQDGIKGYAPDEQDAIQWLITFGRTELGNSRERLCELMDCDWTTVIRICQGKYGAGLGGFMDKIRDLQRRAADSSPAGFVETVVTRKIYDTLDYALAGDLDGGRIVLISGNSRRGKTHAVRQWARENNHGRSIFIDCPESGGLRALFTEIADKTGVNSGRKTSELRDRIIKSFNSRRILIVDEILRVLPTRRSDRRPIELEFIRRLHDVTRCAIALIATPVFEHEMNSGWLRQYLEQLLGRIAEPLIIPEKVFMSEAREIVRAFNTNPEADLVRLAHRIANEPGKLGILYELLRQASLAAKKRGEPMNTQHLAAAYKRRKNRFTWPEEG